MAAVNTENVVVCCNMTIYVHTYAHYICGIYVFMYLLKLYSAYMIELTELAVC